MTAPDAHNRSTPSGAPVTAHEGEALESWLESATATPRRGDPVWSPVPDHRRRSPNGAIQPGTSLQATAEGFHARIARAEHDADPHIPADAIWEKIMASTSSSSTAAVPSLRGIISARSVANRVSTPARHGNDRQRIVPAWLAGGNWAVSALMVAAVLVGIVALYGSFAGSPGPDGGPATNPMFAMGTPGETTTTADDDIDRWLADPSTVDCERDPAGSIDSVERATDRPKPAENYLPFGPASLSNAETIADRWKYLNANCAPTAEDPLVSDDFGWMPGVYGGVIPTADQIATAQEISDALPMQDYRDYYILRKPASPATPVTGAGPGSRLVLLPDDIVHLADGRLGGPLRIVVETADPDFAITNVTAGHETAGTVFVVFEDIDGRWLYDELITVCIGDCDWFWTGIADPNATTVSPVPATPYSATPSADAAFLQPLNPDDCDVEPRSLDEVTALMEDPGESPPRQYLPVNPATASQAEAAASTSRAVSACYELGDPGQWRALASPRFIHNRNGSLQVTSYPDMTYDNYIAWNRELSAALLPNGAGPWVAYSDVEMTPDANDEHPGDRPGFQVVLPDGVVQLPDGRIGGPSTYVVPSNIADFNPYYQNDLEATQEASPYVLTLFDLFARDRTRNDRWVLDERLVLCTGDCDSYYDGIRPSALDDVPVPGTRVATPIVATPATSTRDWLQPLNPDDCDVEPRSLEETAALMQDPGEAIPRQYSPVQSISNPLALDIAFADRTFQSCAITGSAGEWRALVSPRLISEGGGSWQVDTIARRSATYEEYVANHRALSETLLPDPTNDYTVESPQVASVDDGGAFDYYDGLWLPVMVPGDIVQFPDGRIGGPLSELLPANYDQVLRESQAAGNATPASPEFEMVYYRIYAQDPTQNGRWVLDEQLTLCASGCDAFYAQAEALYRSQRPILPATPIATLATAPEVATPNASTDWLAPIAPDECVVEEPRSLEEVGALVQDPGQTQPREYLPVTAVDPSSAEDVALAYRTWEACRASGRLAEHQALETLRYLMEIQPYGAASPSQAETFDEWVALNESLRAEFLAPDIETYLVETNALPPYDCETGYADADLPVLTSFELIQPQHLVWLPDGRIGGPTSMLVGPGYVQCLDENPSTFGGNERFVGISIFAPDPTRGGGWALDEQFALCVSGCEEYYERVWGYLTPATPEAATPGPATLDSASLQPITAGECDVEPLSDEEVSAIVQGSGDDAERSYAPTGRVDPALAEEVVAADRAWQSCFVYGTAGERIALQSPRLTRDGPGQPIGSETSREAMLANLDRFDATRELGDVMLSGDWRDYLVESDRFVVSGTPNVDVLPDFIPTIPISEQATELDDGRVAIPIAQLVVPGSYPFQAEDVDDFPYAYVTVHILVQEPALDGRWVVDETLDLCMGNCDLARARIVEYIDYLDSLASPPATPTPAATPEAWRHQPSL